MAEFPALPLWTDSYLADCGHLSDIEHGRYLRMLIEMWRTPDCRLPNDDEWLARRFRRSVEQVQSELRPIIAEFCQCTGNWIVQKRLQREKSFVRERSARMSVSAKSRWKKQKDAYNSNAPTPTPTPTSEDVRTSSAADAAPDPQKSVFDYGRAVLGKSAGGQVRKLLNLYEGDCAKAFGALVLAGKKSEPNEYVAGILRGGRNQEAPVDYDAEYRRMGVL